MGGSNPQERAADNAKEATEKAVTEAKFLRSQTYRNPTYNALVGTANERLANPDVITPELLGILDQQAVASANQIGQDRLMEGRQELSLAGGNRSGAGYELERDIAAGTAASIANSMRANRIQAELQNRQAEQQAFNQGSAALTIQQQPQRDVIATQLGQGQTLGGIAAGTQTQPGPGSIVGSILGTATGGLLGNESLFDK